MKSQVDHPAGQLRVVHSSHGRFHHHDLARQLYRRGQLTRFFTGYPRWKLRREDLPFDQIETFPWLEVPYLLALRISWLSGCIERDLFPLLCTSFDKHVAKRLPKCDVFMALSGAGLISGQRAQALGAIYVCDRGSTHILEQRAILTEQFKRYGERFDAISPWIIERELAEYRQADLITVPSEFVKSTFLKQGVPEQKLLKVPYGVNLDRFRKTGDPPTNTFEVLFVGTVSYRKGIPDLLDAFSQVKCQKKRLRLIGPIAPEMQRYFAAKGIPRDVELWGRQPQDMLARIFSSSHVMVLPSVEEGLALVMAQALACGCPVIATENTGARDLFAHGGAGFILNPHDPTQIAARLCELADDPTRREHMSANAELSVAAGWAEYAAALTRGFALRRAASQLTCA